MRHRNRRALRALVALHLVAVPLALFTSSEAIASTNTNACLSNATATYSDLELSMTGSAAPDPVEHGAGTVTLSNTTVSVQVPADLLVAGYRLGLLSAGDNTLNATLDVTIEGSNSVEGTATVTATASVVAKIIDPTPANKSSGDESAQPISVSNLALPDTTWTPAAGGSMSFSEKSAHISVPVAGGIITVGFDCKPGTSSSDGTTWTPATPIAFASVTVQGGPSTTAPASTTTTAAATTTTTAAATTTTTASSTTTSTVPGSTTTTGSATYTTSCTNNVTADLSEIPITVKGTVPSVVEAGKKFTLTKHEWKVTVPASVLDTGIGLGLIHAGDVIDAEIDASIFGTNTAEGLQEKKGLSVKVGPIKLGSNGKALPAVATVKPGDMTFTAVKNPAGLELAGAKVSVDLGLPSPVTFSCATAGDVSPFVSLKVEGKTNISVATTTTTTTGSDTTVVGQATTTTAAGTAAGGSSLPRTGPPSTLLSVVAALVLIDLGYLLWSATRSARRRVIVS